MSLVFKWSMNSKPVKTSVLRMSIVGQYLQFNIGEAGCSFRDLESLNGSVLGFFRVISEIPKENRVRIVHFIQSKHFKISRGRGYTSIWTQAFGNVFQGNLAYNDRIAQLYHSAPLSSLELLGLPWRYNKNNKELNLIDTERLPLIFWVPVRLMYWESHT